MSAAHAYEPETPPVVVSPDPESLDATRPDDLDCCPVCYGDGAIRIQVGDLLDDEWDSTECYVCHGTGTLVGAA